MKSFSAVVVLFNCQGNILAVSRKDNYEDLGFPGGKLNINENPEQAAIRETFEETGIILINNLKYIYTGNDTTGRPCRDEFHINCSRNGDQIAPEMETYKLL
jgi:ADP-ribose pyrophosphatase YjhB (NUDIX family)